MGRDCPCDAVRAILANLIELVIASDFRDRQAARDMARGERIVGVLSLFCERALRDQEPLRLIVDIESPKDCRLSAIDALPWPWARIMRGTGFALFIRPATPKRTTDAARGNEPR